MKLRTNVFLLLILLPLILSAQTQQPSPRVPSIRVTGEATLTVPPEIARIQLGVTTEAPRAETAAAQNAERVDRVLSELRKILPADAQIKTISYSVNPMYSQEENRQEPRITGYTANNIVQVEVQALDQSGKIIDTAIQAGANNVHNLQFLLKDETTHQTKALQEAARRAKAKAEALASSLGLKVTRILEIQEGEAVAIPFSPRMLEADVSMKAQTPVEPGTIEVHGTVTVTAEVQ